MKLVDFYYEALLHEEIAYEKIECELELLIGVMIHTQGLKSLD